MDTSPLSSSSSSCSPTYSEDHLPSSSPLLSPAADVEVSKLLSYGPTAQVWRGCLSSGQGTAPVIVKMYSRRNSDHMKNEVLAYELISSHHLDGLAPLYYGAFTMPDQSWGAIVMSDAGEAFRGTWKEAGFSVQELQVLWKHVKTPFARPGTTMISRRGMWQKGGMAIYVCLTMSAHLLAVTYALVMS
ncbi:hypothetical protein EV421DRAFT_345597 [Armillaria borealis]|uniref:Protein kinase domain-containing protein n=1 Tax=Armillaria borealis TaxID=47425 RepID=A0AA39MT87_9AGAR|nr:hypothetical protein EV421DRAFT_345597 [Armillaria borealis]